ncbi:hypothetical protein ACFWDK_24700, partial [Micromonospora chalcea]
MTPRPSRHTWAIVFSSSVLGAAEPRRHVLQQTCHGGQPIGRGVQESADPVQRVRQVEVVPAADGGRAGCG